MVWSRARGTAGWAVLALTGCLVLLALMPLTARAALTIESFGSDPLDVSGLPERQAGGGVWLLRSSLAFGQTGGVGSVASAVVGLPRGLFFNPTASPRCAETDFDSYACPSASQVGLVTLRAETESEQAALMGTAPVYALVPGPGQIARLGVVVPTLEIPLEIPVTLRTNTGFGPTLTFGQLPEETPLKAIDLALWGVPADPGHDPQRFPAGSAAAPAGCPGVEGTSCIAGLVPSPAPQVPLLKNPASCTDPIQSRLEAISHQGEPVVAGASAPGMAGCSGLGFSPGLEATITSEETDSPTGLGLDLEIVDDGVLNPGGLASSAVKELELEGPPGLALGQGAFGTTCGQPGFEAEPPTCPAGSLVGSALLEIVGFEAPLLGDIYLGSPEPADTPRLLIALSSPRMSARLVAELQPGFEPEQVIVALADLPQLPVERLSLEIAPAAGLLLTPLQCDTYPLLGALVPWTAPDEEYLIPGSFQISSGPGGGPCPEPEAEKEEQGEGSTRSHASAPPASAPPSPVPTQPVVRITRMPPHRTHDRTPTFRFSSSPGTTFTCKVDTRPFRPCSSPKTLRRLGFGPHRFVVRAVDATGARSEPAERRFSVVRAATERCALSCGR